jgi:hypothetical protein
MNESHVCNVILCCIQSPACIRPSIASSRCHSNVFIFIFDVIFISLQTHTRIIFKNVLDYYQSKYRFFIRSTFKIVRWNRGFSGPKTHYSIVFIDDTKFSRNSLNCYERRQAAIKFQFCVYLQRMR